MNALIVCINSNVILSFSGLLPNAVLIDDGLICGDRDADVLDGKYSDESCGNCFLDADFGNDGDDGEVFFIDGNDDICRVFLDNAFDDDDDCDNSCSRGYTGLDVGNGCGDNFDLGGGG